MRPVGVIIALMNGNATSGQENDDGWRLRGGCAASVCIYMSERVTVVCAIRELLCEPGRGVGDIPNLPVPLGSHVDALSNEHVISSPPPVRHLSVRIRHRDLPIHRESGFLLRVSWRRPPVRFLAWGVGKYCKSNRTTLRELAKTQSTRCMGFSAILFSQKPSRGKLFSLSLSPFYFLSPAVALFFPFPFSLESNVADFTLFSRGIRRFCLSR